MNYKSEEKIYKIRLTDNFNLIMEINKNLNRLICLLKDLNLICNLNKIKKSLLHVIQSIFLLRDSCHLFLSSKERGLPYTFYYREIIIHINVICKHSDNISYENNRIAAELKGNLTHGIDDFYDDYTKVINDKLTINSIFDFIEECIFKNKSKSITEKKIKNLKLNNPIDFDEEQIIFYEYFAYNLSFYTKK